ncbi:hypothetical protein [Frigidibacter mobilis]|uniref:Porin n=1 Tax=Frigidibacter mobilis TaxID=1335048 RepID=A0A159Z3Q3_9RHOB|nr:hypothetical protein [Frigidibacter mobilis]AMY69767.1 hypothetical protein AKL17_2524 [Frigidibacter mobilis]
MMTPIFRYAPTLSAAALLAIAAPLAAQQITGYDPATGYQTAPGYGGYSGTSTGSSFGNDSYSGNYAGGGGGFTSPNGFYLRGLVEAEMLKNRKEDDSIFYGDISFGYAPAGGGIGADFGLVGYDSSAADDLAVYAALSFGLGDGRMQVGAPRAVLDDFMDIPPVGGSRFLDIGFGQPTSSFVSAYALTDGKTPYGLRYDTSMGGLDLAGSVHQFGGDDVSAADLAAAFEMGAVTLSAGTEYVDGEGPSGFNLILGGKAEFGQMEGGLYYSSLQRPGDIEAWTAYGTWRPSQPISVTGSVVSARESGDEATLYGVSAEYSIPQGAYVQGGILDGDGEPTTFDVSVGWKF